MILEVVVYNIESALKALEGGADRIELCASPGDGGTTPSYGTIEVVRQHVSMDLFVMIRPRGGNFLYSSYEFHAMKRDITQCQRLSADGVVLGILTSDGRIDKQRCKELVDRAKPMRVTCHRAFDCTRDPFEALEDCIEIGFDRILTSGQKNTAFEGVGLLTQLVQKANGRIVIMPGSGVNEKTVIPIVQQTQVKEVHFSAAIPGNETMKYFNPIIEGMGNARTVDPDIIRKIRSLLSN